MHKVMLQPAGVRGKYYCFCCCSEARTTRDLIDVYLSVGSDQARKGQHGEIHKKSATPIKRCSESRWSKY